MFRAMKRKSKKETYQQVLSDLEVNSSSVGLYMIDIGTLGHWLHSSQMALWKTAPSLMKKKVTMILDSATKSH